jgi:hypothetical protein
MTLHEKLGNATAILLCVLSLARVSHFFPYIPVDDGLSYFQQVQSVNNWLFNPGSGAPFADGLFGKQVQLYWPISNSISVYISAFLFDFINHNALPSLINLFYLFLFLIYITKIRSGTYSHSALLLLCAQTLFFRLFSTLTTEFSVGLWIFSYLATLTSKHQHKGIFLAALGFIGLFLRTLDIVFILMALFSYAAILFPSQKNRAAVMATLKYPLLCLILTAPIFYHHYIATYEYIHEASFGISSTAWKSMSGISGRFDVTRLYIKSIFLYNPLLIPLSLSSIALCAGLHAIPLRSMLLTLGISFFVTLPLLLASALNIQVVFWIYTVLTFISCEFTAAIYKKINFKNINLKLNIILHSLYWLGLYTILIVFLHQSWKIETIVMEQDHAISNIAFEMSDILNREPGLPTIASNFFGIGQLDYRGLGWSSNRTLKIGMEAEIFTKKPASDYLRLRPDTNFYIAAKSNYYFSPIFDINTHIPETYLLFSRQAGGMGFRKIQVVGSAEQNYTIWYRPSVQADLPAGAWISPTMSLQLGSVKNCGAQRVSGDLDLSADFENPAHPGFAPPFLVTLRQPEAPQILSSFLVDKYGLAHIPLAVKHLSCGRYEVAIDKSFSTREDSRTLSAMFVGVSGHLRFD